MKSITWVGVVLVFGMLAWVGHDTRAMNQKLDVIVALPKKEKPMPVRETKWKSATGEQVIRTEKWVNETSEQWARRHHQEVVEAQVVDPIIP